MAAKKKPDGECLHLSGYGGAFTDGHEAVVHHYHDAPKIDWKKVWRKYNLTEHDAIPTAICCKTAIRRLVEAQLKRRPRGK